MILFCGTLPIQQSFGVYESRVDIISVLPGKHWTILPDFTMAQLSERKRGRSGRTMLKTAVLQISGPSLEILWWMRWLRNCCSCSWLNRRPKDLQRLWLIQLASKQIDHTKYTIAKGIQSPEVSIPFSLDFSNRGSDFHYSVLCGLVWKQAASKFDGWEKHWTTVGRCIGTQMCYVVVWFADAKDLHEYVHEHVIWDHVNMFIMCRCQDKKMWRCQGFRCRRQTRYAA